MASWRQLCDGGIRDGDGQCHIVERLDERTDRAMLVFMGRIGDVDDDDKRRSNEHDDTTSHTDNTTEDAGIDW